jgi:hypothetical protein
LSMMPTLPWWAFVMGDGLDVMIKVAGVLDVHVYGVGLDRYCVEYWATRAARSRCIWLRGR